MRDGQTLTYADLLEAAQQAAKASGLTQTAVADALGVSQGAISHAISREGARYSALQVKIVEHLTPFTLAEAAVKYVASRRG